ncbi:MAG: GTP cyclohydrolase IIa [Candidatus Hadarchaeales archaeon]
MLQLTLIQLDNYGPWTVTPRPHPEAELQVLQAEIFSSLEEEFRRRKGLVFQARQDNLLALSNGISLSEHRKIAGKINTKFPVTVSMGVGVARTPYEAQRRASRALQGLGSSRSGERRGKVAGETLKSPEEGVVQIAHLDLNHSTRLTDTKPIYDTHLLIQRTHLALMELLLPKKCLVFYTGGDNFMAPSNGLPLEGLSSVFSQIKRRLGVGLKAGVGVARTAERAALLASEGLHEIRQGKVKEPIVLKSEL